MKHFALLPAAALALCLAACNKSEAPVRAPQVPGMSAISFDTFVSATKASPLTTDNISSFGVYAYHTQTSSWTDSALPNYMYNQEVTGSASAGFTYSPVKYWPSATGAKLSFFAYAPYGTAANGISTQSGNNVSGTPKIKFSVPTSESQQPDLVTAIPIYDAQLAATGGTVGFQFCHVLSRITFQVKLAAAEGSYGSTNIYLNAVSLSSRFPASGVLDLGNTVWSDVALGREQPYNRTIGSGRNGLRVTGTKQTVGGESGSILMIPTAAQDFTLTATYSVITPDSALNGGELVYENTFTKTISFQTEKGKSYDFLLTISPSAIEFSAPTVNDWEASGSSSNFNL